MFITFSVDAARGLRVVRYEGVIDDEALVSGIQRLWSDPAFDPALDELNDLSGVTSYLVTPGAIESIAKVDFRAQEEAPATRIAIVAPSDLAYGLARMYGAFIQGSPSEYKIFRSREEADAWLAEAREVKGRK